MFVLYLCITNENEDENENAGHRIQIRDVENQQQPTQLTHLSTNTNIFYFFILLFFKNIPDARAPGNVNVLNYYLL